MSEKDNQSSIEDLSIVDDCCSSNKLKLEDCLNRLEKLENENKKFELLEEKIKALGEKSSSDQSFDDNNFVKIIQYFQNEIKKINNENNNKIKFIKQQNDEKNKENSLLIEKLNIENKKLIEENSKILKKLEESNFEIFKKEKNYLEVFDKFNIIETIKIPSIEKEKIENEKKLNEEIEKIKIEKINLDKLIEQLKNENKCISELFENLNFENKNNEGEEENLKNANQEIVKEDNKQDQINDVKDVLVLIKEKYNELEEKNKLEKKLLQACNLKNNRISILQKELIELYKQVINQTIYVSFPNKINEVANESYHTCCQNKCINYNLTNGVCISKKAYVNVNDDGFIKYYIGEKDSYSGMGIKLYAQNAISKEASLSDNYSLFYFEVKLFMEETKYHNTVDFGIEPYYVMHLKHYKDNNLNSQNNFIDGDVFGCGIIYPPNEVLNKKPYLFFTKNGDKIKDKDQLVTFPKIEKLRPYISLCNCSAEINFGNDLKEKPFIYNISNNMN